MFLRFLSVSMDFSPFSSHWYVILFNHMTYLDIISKYLHNCIALKYVYMYINIYILFSNSYQYRNACVKLPALLCCGHGHVSSSSLLQRTASAGRTSVSRVTLFLSRAPSGIRVGSDDRANRPNEENEPNPLQQKGSLFHRSSGAQSGHRLRWGTKSQTSELMIKEPSNRIDIENYWKHCQAPNVQARTT